MKLAMKTLAACMAVMGFVGLAQAALIVQQSTIFLGASTPAPSTLPSASIPFDVVNPDSILVATAYVDNTPGAYNFSTLNFDGGAPSATFTDSRLTSWIFLNPSTASGLNFNFAKINSTTLAADNSGIGIILYEISGANTSLGSITTSLGSDTITTDTVNELLVSFAGRNTNASTAPTENSSLFTGQDQSSGSGSNISGGGAISSASGFASTIGSQGIAWTNATEGRIAYAFEAVPEPSSIALLGLGGLGLVMLRLRRK